MPPQVCNIYDDLQVRKVAWGYFSQVVYYRIERRVMQFYFDIMELHYCNYKFNSNQFLQSSKLYFHFCLVWPVVMMALRAPVKLQRPSDQSILLSFIIRVLHFLQGIREHINIPFFIWLFQLHSTYCALNLTWSQNVQNPLKLALRVLKIIR